MAGDAPPTLKLFWFCKGTSHTRGVVKARVPLSKSPLQSRLPGAAMLQGRHWLALLAPALEKVAAGHAWHVLTVAKYPGLQTRARAAAQSSAGRATVRANI